VTESKAPIKARGRTKSVRDATKDLGAHSWFWFTNINEIISNDFFGATMWSQTQTDEVKPLLEELGQD
jgi:hypothetical protein